MTRSAEKALSLLIWAAALPVFVAGCAKKPLDVAATVQDATGVALKAIQAMARS